MLFAHPDLLFLLVLFGHIGGSIVAFGPTFAFPFLGSAGGREPQHANFAVRMTELISRRLVGPVALWVGLTGVILVFLARRDFTELWLGLAIVLYVVALLVSIFLAGSNARRLIEATSSPPPMAEQAPAAGSPGHTGPPPHIAPLVAAARRYGTILTLLLVAIVLLMVFKPVLA